jgi:cytochrome c-type biogenesis protein CcmH
MTLKRWAPWLVLGVVLVVAFAIGSRNSGPASAASRAAAIESEVRCPQCEGQSVLASEVPAARAVRAFITQQVQSGATDAEIKQTVKDRFGSDILLRPPSSGVDGLIWVIPIVVLAVAVGGLGVAFWRWRAL